MNGTFIDADHWKGSQILEEIIAQLDDSKMLKVIESLKPEFSKDGNQFCYLYGSLPNDCVVGFGDTAYLAMRDFCNNFYNTNTSPPKSI